MGSSEPMPKLFPDREEKDSEKNTMKERILDVEGKEERSENTDKAGGEDWKYWNGRNNFKHMWP